MLSGMTTKYIAGVEGLARPEELAGEVRAEELRTGAARAVQHQHGVADLAGVVALRRADGAVVETQLGQASRRSRSGSRG